jgi:hypothetical protein
MQAGTSTEPAVCGFAYLESFPDGRRKIEAVDAIVDEHVLTLVLPRQLIDYLELHRWEERHAVGEGPLYGPIRLTIHGRICHTDVVENRIDEKVRIGRLIALQLGLVIDAASKRLVVNPEHGGKWVVDMF